jgi:hypothetical protein
MGDGAIPWIAIREYCKDHGLDRYESERLIEIVRAMDFEYSKYKEQELKAKTPIKKGK